MKFHDSSGNEITRSWGDHWPSCERCREVSLEKSATFANACAEGSPLLMEELTKRQAPVEKQKRKEVEDWAKARGTFKMGKSSGVPTKYVEEND